MYNCLCVQFMLAGFGFFGFRSYMESEKYPYCYLSSVKKQMNAWMHVENRREPSTAQRKNYQHCQRLFLFKQESTIFTLRSPLFLLQTTSGATSKIIRKIYCLNDKQSIFTIPSPTLIFYKILQHLLGGSAKDDSLIKQTHHCCSKMKNK